MDLEMRSKSWQHIDVKRFSAATTSTLSIYLPDVLEELRGIAQGAKVDLSQVLLANQVDTFGGDVERCTPVVLRNAREGPIIAKNNDAPVNEEYPFIVRKTAPAKGLPSIQVTYAGWLNGLDCINAEGLATTHGSVGSVFEKTGKRVDIRLVAYSLMQCCKSTNEFVQKLAELPLTGKGFNIAVGDQSGETAMLDAAVPLVSIRNRNKAFDYATNIYKSPGLEHADLRPPAQREICVCREGYLKWLEETKPPKNLADIKTLLSSHEPWAPCKHGGVNGSKTLWAMINLTESRTLLLTHGKPCENEYRKYSL